MNDKSKCNTETSQSSCQGQSTWRKNISHKALSQVIDKEGEVERGRERRRYEGTLVYGEIEKESSSSH